MNEEDKQAILSNIGGISAVELFQKYIQPELISLEEMMQTGNLPALVRKEIEKLKADEITKENDAWITAENANSIDSYNNYLSVYPNGKNAAMANFGVSSIKKTEANTNNRKKAILSQIAENSNDFTPGEINGHIRDGVFTQSDLIEIGIPKNIISSLNAFSLKQLDNRTNNELIPDGLTEIYFWGIPGSGKTCALAGVLSHALKKGIMQPQQGSGFNYMNQLCNIFRGEIGFLPPSTMEEFTQYLPFHLNDKNNKQHPVALIELSGEIFKCYFKKLAGIPLKNHHVETFETIEKYLKGRNKKVHFFVIDISADPTLTDEDGVGQDQYLGAAELFFKENSIFNNSTDAIYIIATKSDKLACTEEERKQKATEFMMKNYASFINGLKKACEKYKINDNNGLDFIPFSLGEVHFNKICQFKPFASNLVVEILQNKTAKLDNPSLLEKIFRG